VKTLVKISISCFFLCWASVAFTQDNLQQQIDAQRAKNAELRKQIEEARKRQTEANAEKIDKDAERASDTLETAIELIKTQPRIGTGVSIAENFWFSDISTEDKNLTMEQKNEIKEINKGFRVMRTIANLRGANEVLSLYAEYEGYSSLSDMFKDAETALIEQSVKGNKYILQNNIYKNYNLTEEQKKNLDSKCWPQFFKEWAAIGYSVNNRNNAKKNAFSEADKEKTLQDIVKTVENFYHEPPVSSPAPIGNVAGKAEKGSSKIELDNLDINVRYEQ